MAGTQDSIPNVPPHSSPTTMKGGRDSRGEGASRSLDLYEEMDKSQVGSGWGQDQSRNKMGVLKQ